MGIVTSANNYSVVNIGELHTVSDPGHPRRGDEQGSYAVAEGVHVTVREGRIESIEDHQDNVDPEFPIFDARGGVVVPGLIESHSHALFSGNRSPEYARRLAGNEVSILTDDDSSGIHYTVAQTRATADLPLAQNVYRYLDAAAKSGVTTCELKTGYGLTSEEEFRQLEILDAVAKQANRNLVLTFAAAHAVPLGRTAESYAKEITEQMYPRLAEQHPDVLNDVTCEQGLFDEETARKLLSSARDFGFRNKVHADAFTDSGGWRTAVETGALSADHLTYTPVSELVRYAWADTVATVLPVAELTYMTDRRAPARTMIENGIPVALATDYCSSIGSTSLLRTLHLGAPWFSLKPEEALTAVTLNAAYALGVADEAGSIEIGKRGDLVILHADTLADFFWSEPVIPRVITSPRGPSH